VRFGGQTRRTASLRLGGAWNEALAFDHDSWGALGAQQQLEVHIHALRPTVRGQPPPSPSEAALAAAAVSAGDVVPNGSAGGGRTGSGEEGGEEVLVATATLELAELLGKARRARPAATSLHTWLEVSQNG
jgi:hypothetical protein